MNSAVVGYEAIKERYTRSASGAQDPQRLPLIWFDDTCAKLDSAYLIKGLLTSSTLSVVYGKSGSGKTYATQAMSLHIALGLPWRGRRVSQCGVVYIAAEGGDGALNRVAAFRIAHPEHCSSGRVPFATIAAPINLLDPNADAMAIIDRVHEAERLIGQRVGLVVVDTLSRALAGGEENSSQDMGAFVCNVDRIRAETGAHVLIVHHSGKDDARGARGHSLLRAATDTEIEVTHDEASDLRTMRVMKQRDLATEGEFAFRLRSVELGSDQDGDPITACVVEHVEDGPPVRPSVKLPDGARLALEKLHDFAARNGVAGPRSQHIPPAVTVVNLDAYRKHLRDSGVTDAEGGATERQQWKRIREKLLAASQIGIWEDYLWAVS